MSWAKASITLAVVTAALACTLQRLGEYCGLHFPETTHFLAYAPAFLLGTMYWLHFPTFARSQPVLVFAVVPIAGLTYASLAAGNSPLVVAAFLVMGIPIAAMITVHRWWIPAARIFVVANAAALLLILYLDYLVHSGGWGRILARFGFTLLETGEASTNPNQVGGQFALAAVIGVLLFVRSGRSLPQSVAEMLGSDDPYRRGFADGLGAPTIGASGRAAFVREPHIAAVPPRAAAEAFRSSLTHRWKIAGPTKAKALDWWSLVAAGPLTLGCILTGSRGAGLALLASLGVLLFADTRSQDRGRLRDLVALGTLAVWLGCLAVFLSGINPLERIQQRLMGSEGESVRSLGSRLPIWENAFRAWRADAGSILIGAGTGQAEIALGRIDAGAKLGDHGEYRRACHNMFIEWLLSFGVFGLLPGIWFYWTCWRRAALLDRAEGTFSRRTLLLAVTLFGMTADLHRHFHWVVMSAWLLAMLDSASLGAGMVRCAPTEGPTMRLGEASALDRGGAVRQGFPSGHFKDHRPLADKQPVASSKAFPSFPFTRVFQP